MVATRGFLTKSSLLQFMCTCGFLRRRLRYCPAFALIEPVRSFKFINNITYLIFLPSALEKHSGNISAIETYIYICRMDNKTAVIVMNFGRSQLTI